MNINIVGVENFCGSNNISQYIGLIRVMCLLKWHILHILHARDSTTSKERKQREVEEASGKDLNADPDEKRRIIINSSASPH